MGIYRILFAVFSALSLVTVIWTGVREVTPEWKAYQSEYYNLLEQKLEAAGQKDFRRPHLLIQQTWLPSLRRTDRCTTCHMGIENTDHFADAPQPYKAHPGKYLEWHPANKFGCTSCHKGQGLSTDFMYAAHTPPDLDVARFKRLIARSEAGEDIGVLGYQVEDLKKEVEVAEAKLASWEDKYGYDEHKLEFFHDYMLPKKFIEAQCMKCHDSRAIEEYAPSIKQARTLITNTFKCRKCHAIPQITDEPGEPQAPCPDLHGFGDKNAHNLDFGAADVRDAEGALLHTPEEIAILKSLHHDPLEWTVEHFINPQLFILTSQMANFGMTYEQAEFLTAFVRGLGKELPAPEYIARKPLIPAALATEGVDSMFVPPTSVASAAAPAAAPAEAAAPAGGTGTQPAAGTAPVVPADPNAPAAPAAPAEGQPAAPAAPAAPEAQPTTAPAPSR